LKPGYKQTDLGMIPADWEVVEIGDLNPFVTSGSRGWAEFYSGMGFPFIRITNLSRESIFLDLTDLKLVKLPYRVSEGTRTQLENDDVLISITADIGIIGYVTASVQKPAYINQHIALVRFDSAKANARFASYFLACERSQRLFRASTDQGAKAGMSLGAIRKIQLALPLAPEQRAIAAALSDVDALIGGLDQLIAKKRDIKQAAMQQLLTGKQRLPGFCAKWAVKRLADVGTFSKGKGIRKDELVADGIPCVRYGEIYTHHNDYVRRFYSFIPQKIAKQSQRLRKGDLLFAGSGETAEEIGKCVAFIGEEEAYAGGDIVVFSPSNQDAMYLGYLMNHASICEQKARMGQGDAVVHVSARNLGELQLRLPDIEEQRAIAAVLSDMDAEIAGLEQKRDKTRLLKQGMMQELLTGRIRLPMPAEEEVAATP